MSSKTTYYCDRCGCKIPHANHPALSFGVMYETYDLCTACGVKFRKFMEKGRKDEDNL